MPEINDLEVLASVPPSALDPFGLLNEREREVLSELINSDTSLPRPGSVLPLTWNPTPPAPRQAARPRAVAEPITFTPTVRTNPQRCHNCRRRRPEWVVGRNDGPRIPNHLFAGSLICNQCHNRRRRFTDRYTFFWFRDTCSMHPNLDAISFVRRVSYASPVFGSRSYNAVMGMALCETCDEDARHAGHFTRRLRVI